MTTLTKIIAALILMLTLMSCDFNAFGVRGNGNVQTAERELNETFNEIEISRGLDVYLTQDEVLHLAVEADENLHDIIMTKVENNVLKIYASENISYAASQKVMVTFNEVSKITSTSGSDVYSTNTFNLEDIELETTSGSDMELDLNANVIECTATSGSDIRLSGTANKFFANANSGSDIKAGNLSVKTSEANAHSGADIIVNVSEELIANASSGGDIKYFGNPEKVSKSDNVSGKIRKN